MKKKQEETEAEVYQNEIHPEVYIKNRRDSRKRRIEEIVGCILLCIIGAVAFAAWLIAEGVW